MIHKTFYSIISESYMNMGETAPKQASLKLQLPNWMEDIIPTCLPKFPFLLRYVL